MRAIMVNRERNVYSVGLTETGNGYTYTNGPATDGTPNNCRFSKGNFKWRHADKINTEAEWVADPTGAINYAKDKAINNNKRYAYPIAVVDHNNNIVFVADKWVTDYQTSVPMLKTDLEALQTHREEQKKIDAVNRSNAEKTAVFESEIR